jgi:hypothetical protein
MAKYVGPDDGMIQTDIAGVRHNRRNGTFDFAGQAERIARKSGDFTQVGVSLGTIRGTGYVCQDCGFVSLFTTCRCGSTDLVPEPETHTTDRIGPLGVKS